MCSLSLSTAALAGPSISRWSFLKVHFYENATHFLYKKNNFTGVLNRIQYTKEQLTIIKYRMITYIGQLMRWDIYKILWLIFDGKIHGKRSIGRRQNYWFGLTSSEMVRTTVLLKTIAILIANLRKETL